MIRCVLNGKLCTLISFGMSTVANNVSLQVVIRESNVLEILPLAGKCSVFLEGVEGENSKYHIEGDFHVQSIGMGLQRSTIIFVDELGE